MSGSGIKEYSAENNANVGLKDDRFRTWLSEDKPKIMKELSLNEDDENEDSISPHKKTDEKNSDEKPDLESDGLATEEGDETDNDGETGAEKEDDDEGDDSDGDNDDDELGITTESNSDSLSQVVSDKLKGVKEKTLAKFDKRLKEIEEEKEKLNKEKAAFEEKIKEIESLFEKAENQLEELL